jgi:hypothetical protein
MPGTSPTQSVQRTGRFMAQLHVDLLAVDARALATRIERPAC